MYKFEVGKLYRIGGAMGEHVGNVIRITGRKTAFGVNRYDYEMVRGEPVGPRKTFDEKSIMGVGLIPVMEKIVIYRKDNKVVAVDKATGKEGVARCAPDDTFNFETGAKLAFKRLVGEDTVAEPVKPEAPKFKVGEFVRVVSAKTNTSDKFHHFPIGQIVEVVDIERHDEYFCRGVVKTHLGCAVSRQIVKADHIEKVEEA